MSGNNVNLNYVYIFPSVHNTVNVVNYAADNNLVNTFLWHFDVWGSTGHFKINDKISNDPYKQALAVWFECSKEFMELCKTETMQKAFKQMGVEVVFEYPFENI